MPFVPRNGRGLDAVIEESAASDDTLAMVFTNSGIYLASAEGQLTFHLGTAFIRLQALERGELDPLLRALQPKAGDAVLDTTFGLGRDARLVARAVGTTGQVVGVESSVALFMLASEGIARLSESESSYESNVAARSAPITLVNNDALAYLETCADDSFDVVMIDPMFDTPTTSDRGFELLRAVADPTPLSEAWVVEARRVARRCVVVKTAESRPWFDDAGLTWVPSHSNASWYRASGEAAT